jgi:transposase
VPAETELANLPEDSESLKALLRSLTLEHQREQQRANELYLENLREKRRANELHLDNLRLQQELVRLKKLYCGPRVDRLQSEQELAQALLDFAEQLENKPIHPEDIPVKTKAETEPEYELRRVKRRKGRRQIANFENLPVTTHIHELKPEERACPGCGQQRKEMGEEKSWQVEYIPGRFERIEHVRKKYACPQC